LYKKGGIQSLYRGVGITIVRGRIFCFHDDSNFIFNSGIPTWGVYFCTYDGLKRALRPEGHE
jgi:hypothetical protein